MSIRIINGTAYASETASWWRVKAHDLGNGHLEVAATRPQVWKELDWSPQMVQDHLDMVRDAWQDAPEELEAERREKMLRIAANRAKTRVRKLCKAMGVDTLLTLTYRTNEQDLARCKADLKAFNRKMLRVMPGFGFVAAFEHQERGALHVHMATRGIPKTFELVNSTGQKYRVKSYNVIRAIWRSVTKEREGNIDVQRRKRAGEKRPAAIARYIAGYIIKEFAEGEKHSNRWTKYGECTLPPPVQLGTVLTAQEAIEVAFALLNERHTVDMSVYSKWGDWFFLSGEGGNVGGTHG